MNTVTFAPMIKQTGMRDYEFILEDLEMAFPKEQLDCIVNDWNQGMDLESVSNKYKRHPDEVFLALYHKARNGKKVRPFAYRITKPEAVDKGTKHTAVVEVKKLKKGEPSVIEIGGKRFVYEPETKRM